MRRGQTRGRPGAAALAAAFVLLAFPAAAQARGLTLGFGDPAFAGGARESALDRSLAANAKIVRLGVNWSAVAPNRPLDPDNPADPAYRFAEVDAAVRSASGRGLEIILEIGRAPAWAEGPNRPAPGEARAGTWRPDPVAYGQFSRAVARRFGGGFSPAPGQPALPRVTRFQAGNEPNLSAYLTPQWAGGELEAAAIYRELLREFHAGVKGADPANLVITAGTAPYGEEPGNDRTRPLTFLRALFCLDGRGARCAEPVPFDVLAHHPINAGRPFAHAEDPNDATTPDIGRVRAVLRKAERKGRTDRGPHPIWVTEFWWESDPPDRVYGVRERTHARYIAEALYLFWKQRVPLVLGLQLADAPVEGGSPGASFQTGLYFADGRPKDALTAFRFPLVAVRGQRATRIWGLAPTAGKLVIQRRRGKRWRAIERTRVGAGEVFRERLRGGGKVKLRAKVGGERSLAYKARKRR